MGVFVLVIFCSKRLNPPDSYQQRNGNGIDQEKPRFELSGITDVSSEQTVVIMAGDQTPSYIATPSPPPPPRLSEEV